MNSISDKGSTSAGEPVGPEFREPGSPRANWREALLGLIADRVALIQLESKDASRSAAKRAALVASACACVFFAWALFLTAGVSILSKATGMPLSWVALGLAALHLLVGYLMAKSAKSSESPSFPVTRAEFRKDREWIENFNKDKKSSN